MVCFWICYNRGPDTNDTISSISLSLLNRPSTPSPYPSSLRTGPIPLKTEPMDGDGGDDSNLGDLSPTTTKENKNGGEKDKIHNMNNNGNGGGAEEGGVVKANKGMILRKSVEYIRWVFFSFCACFGFSCTEGWRCLIGFERLGVEDGLQIDLKMVMCGVLRGLSPVITKTIIGFPGCVFAIS